MHSMNYLLCLSIKTRNWQLFLSVVLVWVPEGTFFGAAVSEDGVADFLKVMGLTHTFFYHSLISISHWQFHKFTGGELSLPTP